VKRSRSLLLLSLLIPLAACAAEAGSMPSQADRIAGREIELSLEVPERGFQVSTVGRFIEPGDELRTCEVVQLPGGPNDMFYVGRIEAAMTDRGQDLIVSAALPGSHTAAIMDVGANVPCTRSGEAFGEELVEVLSMQEPYLEQRFPAGVGRVLRGGQKLAIDAHFVNPTDEPAPALVKLSFHTVPAEAIQHVAHTATFENLTIYTPPGGESSHLAECLVGQDIVVGELVRRTQQRGTDFTVWVAGGERDGQLLWHSKSIADPRVQLDAPLHLAAGEGLRFQCDYVNATGLELRFGVNAGDEMCTLGATYWPSDSDATSAQGCLLLEVDADGVARN
jgi:hypothetical protein